MTGKHTVDLTGVSETALMTLLVRHPVEQKEVAATVAPVRVVLAAIEPARREAGCESGHELHE